MSKTRSARDERSMSETQNAPQTAATVNTVTGPHCHPNEAEEPMGGDPPCWAHLFEDDLNLDNL